VVNVSVKILFLGPLRDIAGRDFIDVSAPLDWPALLAAVGSEVADQLNHEKVNIACAGTVLSDKTLLSASDGDEIALLPPVSGG